MNGLLLREDAARPIVANSWHTLRSDTKLVNERQRHTLAEGLAFERQNSPGRVPGPAERLTALGKTKQLNQGLEV